jgi:L-amino acid N-acyltransferase YncA
MTACIRLATPDDASGIHAIYAPIVRDTVISFEVEPPTVEETCERISSITRTHPWLVCDDAGIIAGYAYAGAHQARAAYQWAANVSIYNHPAYHRRGLGRALYGALFELLRRQGMRQACAGITLPNEASVGLHEALGFKPVGIYSDIGYKFGAWHAVGWWQMPLTRTDGPPSSPVHLPALAPDHVGEACSLGTAQLSF